MIASDCIMRFDLVPDTCIGRAIVDGVAYRLCGCCGKTLRWCCRTCGGIAVDIDEYENESCCCFANRHSPTQDLLDNSTGILSSRRL